MGARVSFDPITKIIQVTEAPTMIDGEMVVDLDIKIDVYSDGKEDWLSTPSLTKFRFPIRTVGGDSLPGGKSLGSTFFLNSAWKIRPYEASHRFRISGNLYSEDGKSPYTSTIGAYNIFFEASVSNLVDTSSLAISPGDISAIGASVWDQQTGSEAPGSVGKRIKDIKSYVAILLTK